MKKDLVKVTRESGRSSNTKRLRKDLDMRGKVHPSEYDEDVLLAPKNIYQDSRQTSYPNYSIVERVLKSQVGRPWNDVYSELCQINSKNDSAADDFKKVVNRIVETNIMIKDGDPWGSYARWGFRVGYDGLYVHPETGILCYAERKPHVPKKKPITKITNEDGSYFELLEDKWYHTTYEKLEKPMYVWSLHGYVSTTSFNTTKKSCNKKQLKLIKDFLDKHG
ncbi:MAG: hypothetical protein ACRYGG_12230 [Janthinobacterium lividum]